MVSLSSLLITNILLIMYVRLNDSIHHPTLFIIKASPTLLSIQICCTSVHQILKHILLYSTNIRVYVIYRFQPTDGILSTNLSTSLLLLHPLPVHQWHHICILLFSNCPDSKLLHHQRIKLFTYQPCILDGWGCSFSSWRLCFCDL